jgi:CRISPR system Cascade subunit CasE
MYLSRVEIRPQLRATKLALNSPQRLHAIVAASFPQLSAGEVSGGSGFIEGLSVEDVSGGVSVGGTPVEGASGEGVFAESVPQRHLWRLDKLGPSLYLLVASAIKPDFTHLVEQVGWGRSQQTWETKSYEPFLAHLQQGQEWRFRLRANPTHSRKRPEAPQERGVIRACATSDEQKKWLAERADKHGFSLKDFEVVDRNVSGFKRQERTVTLHIATFEGLLKVEEPALLREALTSGIGRAKAYGCGLLTLAKPHVGT